MLALALKYGQEPYLLKNIASKENISEKYLSQIIMPLKAQGLVNSFRGAKGGYALSRSPSEITLAEIVEALEGKLKLINCPEDAGQPGHLSIAVLGNLWGRISDNAVNTLRKLTLKDLVKEYKDREKQEIIYNI